MKAITPELVRAVTPVLVFAIVLETYADGTQREVHLVRVGNQTLVAEIKDLG